MMSVIAAIVFIGAVYLLTYSILYQTPAEKAQEDKEQMEYLKELSEKRSNKYGNAKKRTGNGD
ncbi:MAG: hypothetical protein ACRC3H_23550 [Lachnospiraceae bacterium]